MAVSTSKIKVGQAQAMAEYYESKVSEIIADIAQDPEHEDKTQEQIREIARVKVARLEAKKDGRDPDKAEQELRADWASQKVGGQTAYYAAEESDERHVWMRGPKKGQPLKPGELKDMFLGRSEGRRLDDPQWKQIEKAARTAGYQGEVTGEVVEALREGRDPQTGQQLTGEAAKTVEKYWSADASNLKDGDVSAYDMTFSAPKAVSILAAFGDDATREALVAAQQAAVDRALDFAQEQGVVVGRRGKGGVEKIAAEFQMTSGKVEFSSREGDPQLHTHMLASAFVKGEDGRISAMDGQAWFGASAAMDAAYLRALSEEMYKRVGIQLEHRQIGDKVRLAGVPGISREVEDQFSTRRQQINELLGERMNEQARLEEVMGKQRNKYESAYQSREEGLPQTPEQERKAEIYQKWLESGADPQAAALDSRSSKAEESEAEFLKRIQSTPVAEDMKGLLKEAQQASGVETVKKLDEDTVQSLWSQMDDELVKSQARFSASEALSAAVRLAPKGVSTEDAMKAGRQYLNERAVRLEGAPEMSAVGAEWRHKASGWTTQEVVDQRERINADAQRLAAQTVKHAVENDQFGRAKTPGLDSDELAKFAGEVAARKTLSGEQQEMLAAVLTGQRCVTVNGFAGTGKSHALKALAEVLHESGAEVTVMATKAQLASDLGAEIGANRSMTLARADDEKWGVFNSDTWQRGMAEHDIKSFHYISKQIDEARLKGDEKDLARAEALLEQWHQELPSGTAEKFTDLKESLVEDIDGAAKALGVGKARQWAYQEREKLDMEKEGQAGRFTRVDHNKTQVIVVDEAGMMADDHMEDLLEYASRNKNVQVVMVGDYAQLNAVERSGAFREVLDHVEPVELSDIRRAKHEWERDAQTEMHELDWDNSEETQVQAKGLVDTYDQHDRLHSAGTAEEVKQAIHERRVDPSRKDIEQQLAAEAAADWYMEHSKEREVPQETKTGKSKEPKLEKENSAVLVPTQAMQADVASAIQERLYDSGELDREAQVAELKFGNAENQKIQHVQKGERITFRENINEMGIKNGWQAEVLAVRNGGGLRTRVTDEHGRSFTKVIPQKALDAGVASLSYSSTVHRAQGQTLDSALYVHDPSKEEMTDRQLIYPAMTRGKETNEVLLVGEREDGKESLARSMSLSKNGAVRAIDKTQPTAEDYEKAREQAARMLRNGADIDVDEAAQRYASQRAGTEAAELAEQQRESRAERSKLNATVAKEREKAAEDLKTRRQRKEERKAQENEDLKKGRVMAHQKVKQHALSL